MLGKIYEKKGLKAQATENYEKFLDLRKDADPGTLRLTMRGRGWLDYMGETDNPY